MNKISRSEWEDSQRNELAYWRKQYAQGNPEQNGRWEWYALYVFKGWWDRKKWVGQDLLDYGSGPEGVLHRIEARTKTAVDSLMADYVKIGYKVAADNVRASIVVPDMKFHTIFCLNMLDHTEDPAAELRMLAEHLEPDGELAVCTDLRPKDRLDAYHKLQLTDEAMEAAVEEAGLYGARRLVPHQGGNRNIQWVAILHKRERA